MQGPSSQEKPPAHVPPPMMEAVITVPAKDSSPQALNKLEEVAASTPLSGTHLTPPIFAAVYAGVEMLDSRTFYFREASPAASVVVAI